MKIADIKFTALEPISHISHTESSTSFLVRENIFNGYEVFEVVLGITGNAVRTTLRKAGMRHMCRVLDLKEKYISIDIFNVLASGGYIDGAQKVDIDFAVALRELLPWWSLFAGGTGSMILSGLVNVSPARLLCIETSALLGKPCMQEWGELTQVSEFTRVDSAKDDLQAKALTDVPDDKRTMQMRYGVENIIAGAELYSKIFTKPVPISDMEKAALMACLVEFGEYPFLGGQHRIDMGRVKYEAVTPFGSTITGDGEGGVKADQAITDMITLYVNNLKTNSERIKTFLLASNVSDGMKKVVGM